MALQRIAIVNPDGVVWSVCDWDEEAAPDWRPPFPEHRIVRDPPDFVGVGWRVDKQTREWSMLPTPRRSEIPLAEFLDRFTEDEQLALIEAEARNPRLRMWKERLLAAPVVNLDDRRLRAGLEVAKDLGVLTDVRMLAVLV